MRKTAAVLATTLFIGGLFTAESALAQVKDHREIKTPPLRSFSLPQPKRIQLDNGMVIFIQEDKELPLIRGSATIRGGNRDVPASKAGMTGIYSQAWRTGGTKTRTGDELDQFLESRAAMVETSGSVDNTTVSLNVLKGDFDTVFPIWLDLLRNPAFRQEKIDLAKTQANTGISRRNDEPGSILNREATRLGYGPNSPYARQAEYATIAAITQQDLVDFHRRTVHPNNIILAFIGDFDAAQLEKRLRDTFSSWQRGPQVAKPDPGITQPKPGIYYVAKEDVTQANIAMVHAATADRSNPDYPALQVMNEIFSGGFSGRLMQRLRSERGLTYGVGGGVTSPWDYPGLFRLTMATKSETAIEAVEALRGEVTRLVNDPVTPTELSLAKESILNAYVFTMDTREKALTQRVQLEFYGFPADYFTKYPSLIQQVTAADVQRVAKKYVQPDQLAVLVVGKQSGFEKPLTSLGPVTPIDITIPSADAATTAGGSNPAGMALVRKVQDFVGGKAAIDAVTAVRQTASRNMVTPQGPMSAETVTLLRYPDSLRQEMTLSMGKVTTVIAPARSFMITPMGTQDMPGSQRDQAAGELKTEVINVLKNVDNPKYTFTTAGTNGTAQILAIGAEGSTVRWAVDPATGRLLRTIRSGQAGETVTEYTEWKKFGNLNFATSAQMTRGGEKSGDMRVTNVEVNPTIDANAFVKP
ncbi:MAG TPA: pitrilysin family protein [Thermoanaerobaculia bacterium]|jgi:zinc protease